MPIWCGKWINYYDSFKGILAHTKCCPQYSHCLNWETELLQKGHLVRRRDTTTALSLTRSPCFMIWLSTISSPSTVRSTGAKRFSALVVVSDIQLSSRCFIFIACSWDGSLFPHHFCIVLIDTPSSNASCFFEILLMPRYSSSFWDHLLNTSTPGFSSNYKANMVNNPS